MAGIVDKVSRRRGDGVLACRFRQQRDASEAMAAGGSRCTAEIAELERKAPVYAGPPGSPRHRYPLRQVSPALSKAEKRLEFTVPADAVNTLHGSKN